MVSMSNKSLLDLPRELHHLIFNYIDTQTILCSVRLVCRDLYAAAETYNKLRLKFSSISISKARSIANVIQPENIISLVLVKKEQTESSPVDLFFSLYQLDQFTRLQSMTLVEINGSGLDRLFQHMIVCRLRSLSITLRRQTAIESDRIIRLISSTISQSGLKNLNLNTNNLQMVIDDVSRPIQNILRHLIIRTCTYQEYQRILYCCPHLRHFVLEKCLISSLEIVTTPFTSTSYSKLISLTLYTWSLSIDQLHFFLSLTPSLICLKIISRKSSCLSLFDGNSWEQFIQSKLLHLRTLEFFFSYQVSETTPVLSLDSILPSFKTPFWLNKKRWLVISEYHITSSEITLFTVPRYTNDVERVIRCDSLSVDNCCRVLVRHWTTHPEYVYTEDVCKY